MGHLPREVGSELVTKTFLREELAATKSELRLELRAVEEKLRGEIHKVARTQLLAYTTIVAVLNGITFTALKLA